MATTYKVLGQVAPSDTANATLYTVPANTQAVVSSIAIANRSATGTTYRIAVRPSGASVANQHWLAYDVAIAGNTTVVYTMGATLGATDVVTVASGATTLSFSAFGSELS